MSKTSDHINWQEKLPYYYLPHHSVIREASTTTRLRVVFDGSAKSSSGLSVNDVLMVGPSQQDSIFSLLIRFRKHRVVLKADCEKMYRQIWIHPEDRKFQKIIWYNEDKKSLAEYELDTLTYGTSCAPYIAVRCLFQLAFDERDNYPKAAKVTENDFFMDDLVTGTNTVEEAVQLHTDLTSMFQSAGFNLRKWSSNNKDVLAAIPEQVRDGKINLEFDENTSVKTLGLGWNMKTDNLYYDIIPSNNYVKLTKRVIISDISRYYDPLGLLSPVIIVAKIIIQKLWLANLNWDDEIVGDFAAKWWKFHSYLSYLKDLQVCRNIVPFKKYSRIEFHGFCDASESGFCACIYVRVVSHENEVACNLLCCKSRVSPLRQLSLARLELLAAVLLAKLMSEVTRSWNGNVDSCYAWTDSMIVLSWIKQEPRTWKTFVANRVSQIQELCNPSIWRHVPSDENPADLATRGISANLLRDQKIWWHGPHWLSYSNISDILEKSTLQSISTDCEKKKLKPSSFVTQTDNFPKIELWNKFSSLSTMIRVMAWCLRFIKNISVHKRNKQLSISLETSEIKTAKITLIKLVQQSEFSVDISQIEKKGQVKNDSNIKSLIPFLDNDGILRVGGRLKNSDLPDGAKHQILLPHNHNFSKLVVEYFHNKNCHAGPNLLLALTREEYWIIRGLNLTKKVFHNCIPCFRSNPNRTQPHQLMGDLPQRRVTASPPFSSCGVDYAGPFLVKRMGGRHNVLFKSYFALFVCFSSKAYHIEIVSDLTTMGFLAALRRFVSRRGMPSDIYSDNGSNFVGCDNVLKNFKKQLQKDPEFHAYYTNEHITWHFIPAHSPHMGGLWESGVKAVKSLLKRTMSDQPMTFEQLNTVTCIIEGVLNSRPLTPLSNDVNDMTVLTPGHFLIGRPITSIPEPNIHSSNTSLVQRWKLVQHIQNSFWKRWYLEYLNTLTQRQKWSKPSSNVQQGELVLLKEDNLPPMKWSMGRVIDVFPGNDSNVRVVSIKTKHGTTKRAVCRIVRLPTDE